MKSHSSSLGSDPRNNQYVGFVTRDLGKIVECVVPAGREGLPNLISTKQVRGPYAFLDELCSKIPQILESWRSKRVIDPQVVDEAMSILSVRDAPADTSTSHEKVQTSHISLSRNEVFKRIEEDRERHKRLRERRWVQPISHNAPSQLGMVSFLPLDSDGEGDGELAIDVEFENDWETTSDWNEDDVDAVTEETELCFPAEGEGPMDLS